MKSRGVDMKTNRLIILMTGLTLAALMFSGCARTNNTDTAASNSALAVNGNANMPSSAPAMTANANNGMTTGDSTTNQGRVTRSSKDPEPKIGAGGNDFYLFTQARAALSADSELKNSNIVVDVKNGSATLSGTIANAEQKARAEQLVRALDGITDVKNQLKISAGSPKR